MSEDATLGEFVESESEDDIGKKEDWTIEKVKNHTKLISGAHVKSDNVNNDSAGEPYLTGPDDFEGLGFRVTKYTDSPTKYCEPGDTLVTVKGSGCGKTALSDQRACISRQLKALRPESSINFLHLYYSMKSKENFLQTLSEGSAIPGLSNSHLTTLDIPVPQLSEQRKIATVLYTIDQAIEKTEEVLEQTHTVKKALMQNVFHGRHKDFGEYEQTPVGEIPSDWSVVTIGDVVQTAQYGISESLSEEGQYPIFRMNNIENGYVIDEPLKYIDLDNEEFEKYRVKEGDILFNRTNSLELVGKTGIYELEGDHVFASYLVRLQTNNKTTPYYLNYYMNSSEAQNRMMDFATKGVSQANINANSIQQVKIPLPSLEEQKEIAERIRSIDLQIETNQQYKSQLQRHRRGLMQDLLSGTVRTTDTNIEVPDEIVQHG
ncbi:restriction endonuclease subunit S [Natrinema hispanicum]|uniref:Type I restriction enzyme, S subunit n=1 Tax=Natrinema hispanicum TaxID=392421 RepID=A0A1G6WRJ6_9EURY|nr:restriction endonuclease subunit S [Natrinema hispanicum]SDD68502.1 type I restriction enzyme, S subunit [Natrinema hispanicum]